VVYELIYDFHVNNFDWPLSVISIWSLVIMCHNFDMS